MAGPGIQATGSGRKIGARRKPKKKVQHVSAYSGAVQGGPGPNTVKVRIQPRVGARAKVTVSPGPKTSKVSARAIPKIQERARHQQAVARHSEAMQKAGAQRRKALIHRKALSRKAVKKQEPQIAKQLKGELARAEKRMPTKTAGLSLDSLKKELKGTGVLAKAGKKAGDFLADVTTPASEKGKPLQGADKLGVNLGRDLFDLPASVIPSAWEAGKAVLAATGGDFKPAKKLATDYAETGFLPAVVKGDGKEAKRRFIEHPLYSTLEASGAKAVAGRGTGAVMRSGAAGKKAKAAASTKRAPLKVYGNIEKQRRYSPDATNKVVQVAREKRKARRGMDPHQATPSQTKRILNKRVDVDEHKDEGVRRANREEIQRFATPGKARRMVSQRRQLAGVPEPKHADLVPLIMQRIVRSPETALKDLGTERTRLQKVYETESLEPNQKRANRETAKRIDEIIKSENIEGAFAKAKAFEERRKPVTDELIKRGALDPEASRRAPLLPYAVTRMGAKHDSKKRKTPAMERYEAATTKPARVTEDSLEAAYGRVRDDKTGASLQNVTVPRPRPFKETGLSEKYNRPATQFDVRAEIHVGGKKVGHVTRIYNKETGALVKTMTDVLPEYQKRGIASSLARAEEKELARVGVRKTQVVPSGAAGKSLSAKVGGWRDVGNGRLEKDLPQAVEKKPKKGDRKFTPWMVDKDGKPITPEDVEARMKSEGVEKPTFVSHRARRGKGAFYVTSKMGERTTLPSGKRTGEAVRKGTWDSSPEALAEDMVYQQGVLDSLKRHDRRVETYGLKKPDGQFFKSVKAAKDFMESDDFGNKYPTDLELTPVRIAPFRSSKAAQDAIKEGIEGTGNVGDRVNRVSSSVLTRALEDGDGDVVLMPKQVLDRMGQHAQPRSAIERKVAPITTAFKRTVLPTSPKWLAANATEQAMRMTLTGHGLTSLATGRRAMKALEKVDPQTAQLMKQIALGGQHYGVTARKIHSDPGPFQRTPGVGHVVRGYGRLADLVLAANAKMERIGQYAALGKEVKREVQSTTGAWHKAIVPGGKALQDAVDGMTDTNTQHRYGQAVDNVFGQWGKNSPAARSFLSTYAPFAQWARASAKFVFLTMPKDHPIVTSMLTAIVEMTEEERQKLGLTKNPGGGVDAKPGWLQGSIPVKGGMKRVQGFTSFGTWADPWAIFGNMFIPQISSTLDAMHGKDFLGRELKTKEGKPLTEVQRAVKTANVFGESVIPGMRQTREYREGGGKTHGDSNFLSPSADKPKKNDYTGWNKILNPVPETMENQASGKKTLKQELYGKKKKTLKEELYGSSKKTLREELYGS